MKGSAHGAHLGSESCGGDFAVPRSTVDDDGTKERRGWLSAVRYDWDI